MSRGTDLHALLDSLRGAIAERAGASVAVQVEPALVPGYVAAGPANVEQAILALVDNALAAMGGSGVLTVRTEHVQAAGAEFGPVPPLMAGRYLRVTVQDTGRGMDEAARQQAIDVRPGEVRGLGEVLELVREIRGALWLDSAVSWGTRAFLYLPKAPEGAPEDAAPEASTVLLVEDEMSVRAVVRRMLAGQGFTVREALDGESALRVWQAERAHVRAVVTDVVMPVMGGRDLARELRARDPALPVLFISAYAGDEPGLLDGVEEPRLLLVKPFTNDALLVALRDLLTRRP